MEGYWETWEWLASNSRKQLPATSLLIHIIRVIIIMIIGKYTEIFIVIITK